MSNGTTREVVVPAPEVSADDLAYLKRILGTVTAVPYRQALDYIEEHIPGYDPVRGEK